MLGRGWHVFQRGFEVGAVVLHGLWVEADGCVGGAVWADLHALWFYFKGGIRVGLCGFAGGLQQDAYIDGYL